MSRLSAMLSKASDRHTSVEWSAVTYVGTERPQQIKHNRDRKWTDM